MSTAIRFLTVLPLSWRAEDDSGSFSVSLYFFPVVGALIGSFGYLLSLLLCLFLPIEVAAVCMLGYLAFISGGLHLDGLADSADGLLSSRPRERALEIMKDSRTGAMGVIAIVFILLGKYAALSSMDAKTFSLAIFFIPLVGRCSLVFVMAVQKYARKEGGLGLLFYSEKSKKAAVLSLLILVSLLALFAPRAIPVVFVTLFCSLFFFTRWCNSKLGGATGDTLGGGCEITEMVTAIAFVTLT